MTETAGIVVLPVTPSRRGAARASRWWGKAWVRAVEESSNSAADLAGGRSLSRSGRIGQISVSPGRFVAAVDDVQGLWAVVGGLPVLEPAALDALVEVVAAEPGRVAALRAGELPHELVEHAEEAGVELLPFGSELATSCSCEAWADPCPHALAVMFQLGWLLDADPLVLLLLRGLPQADLLARLHVLAARPESSVDVDIDTAAEAALWSAALLAEADADLPPDRSPDQ